LEFVIFNVELVPMTLPLRSAPPVLFKKLVLFTIVLPSANATP